MKTVVVRTMDKELTISEKINYAHDKMINGKLTYTDKTVNAIIGFLKKYDVELTENDVKVLGVELLHQILISANTVVNANGDKLIDLHNLELFEVCGNVDETVDYLKTLLCGIDATDSAIADEIYTKTFLSGDAE